MQDFHKLQVYQDAFKLSKLIFKEIKDLKHFRLKEQLFGSITSICANLAEMSAFDNVNQIKQKVKICIGEANETEFWLDFCSENDLIELKNHKVYIDNIKIIRMKLFNLLKSINS